MRMATAVTADDNRRNGSEGGGCEHGDSVIWDMITEMQYYMMKLLDRPRQHFINKRQQHSNSPYSFENDIK
jgi:hypothetical protein